MSTGNGESGGISSQLLPRMTYIRSMRESYCHSKRGFTLLEVLVVIAILGILGGLGVVSMREKVALEAVKGDVVILRTFLDEVSTRARAKDTSFSVKVAGDSLLYFLGVACTGTVQGMLELNSKVTVNTGATTDLPAPFTGTPLNWAASNSCIQFTPRSRVGLNPLATEGYIVVKSKSRDLIRGLVGKVSATNKPLQFFTMNGGTLWAPQ